MVRRFFRDSAIYALPAALSSGISFFLFPFYAHHFTASQYGAFDLLILTGTLVGWTVALEIYQAVGRYTGGEPDVARVRSYASTALWFATGAYAAFAIVVELFATPISHILLGTGVKVSLLRVASAWMCVQGLLAIAQAQLRWQLRPAAFATASVINAIITALTSVVLVFGAQLDVEGAILGQLTGSAVALGYVLIATRGTFRLHFDVRKWRQMVAYSAPLVPASAGLFLNLYADRMVIQHMRSLSDVGVYGVGYRLAAIVSLLLAGFQGAMWPLILSRKDDPSTPADLARIFRIFAAIALSAFVVLTIMATPLIRILAAAEYQRATSVVPFLVISALFAGMYMFAPGLFIAEQTRTTAKLSALAGVCNLALALVLVPPLGIVGAGIATAGTSVAWFAALMVGSQRHYQVPHRWRELLGALIVVTGFVAVSLTMLPDSRAQALDASTLAVRVVLVAAGIALSARLTLGGELNSTVRGVSDAIIIRRARARRAASVIE